MNERSAVAEPLARPDIMRWLPAKWEFFLGNHQIIKQFRRLVKKVRRMAESGEMGDNNNPNFLLTGPSRSGKTALVKFLMRCIACQQFDPRTLNPCDGRCPTCRERPETVGLEGLFAYHAAIVAGGDEQIPIHLSVIDCSKILTPSDFRAKLDDIGLDYQGIRIIYLDEVHRLVSRSMDEMLLKTVEERRAIWLFSTAKPGDLEDMFTNRVLKLQTELPEPEEMAEWLAARCNEWQIRWRPEAIVRLVEKSNRVVGTAMHALVLAALDDEAGLSLDLVENDWTTKLDA
jgi:DNA polymerase III delta prime subunit